MAFAVAAVVGFFALMSLGQQPSLADEVPVVEYGMSSEETSLHGAWLIDANARGCIARHDGERMSVECPK